MLKHTHNINNVGSNELAFTAGKFDRRLNTLKNNDTQKTILTENNSGGEKHNNMPPYITIMYFMKI